MSHFCSRFSLRSERLECPQLTTSVNAYLKSRRRRRRCRRSAVKKYAVVVVDVVVVVVVVAVVVVLAISTQDEQS